METSDSKGPEKTPCDGFRMSSCQNRTTERLAEDKGSPTPPDLGDITLISSEPASLLSFGLAESGGGGGGRCGEVDTIRGTGAGATGARGSGVGAAVVCGVVAAGVGAADA